MREMRNEIAFLVENSIVEYDQLDHCFGIKEKEHLKRFLNIELSKFALPFLGAEISSNNVRWVITAEDKIVNDEYGDSRTKALCFVSRGGTFKYTIELSCEIIN